MELTRRQMIGGIAGAIAAGSAKASPIRSGVAARGISSASAAPEDNTYWHDLFAAFIEDTIPAGTAIEIPCETWPKSFVFVGMDGVDVSFPYMTDISAVVRNGGFYQNKCAAIRFPNATGNMGQQMFNNCSGYNGTLDVYLPKITGFVNSQYVLYGSNCHDKRFHFGVTCQQILGFTKINSQTHAEYSTLIGTDGYLTWNGSSWDFNNFS